MQSKQVMKTLELKLVFESAVRLLPKLYVQLRLSGEKP